MHGGLSVEYNMKNHEEEMSDQSEYHEITKLPFLCLFLYCVFMNVTPHCASDYEGDSFERVEKLALRHAIPRLT